MEIKRKDNQYYIENEIVDLKQVYDFYWKKYKGYVQYGQMMMWCYLKNDDHYKFISLSPIKDSSSLKQRVINYDVETGNNITTSFAIGMGVLGMFDEETPMEPRWNHLDDYELIGFSKYPITDQSIPIVELKK